ETLETCAWERTPVENGWVLGTSSFRVGNDSVATNKLKSLIVWRTLGKGTVLGLGHNVVLEDYVSNGQRQNLEVLLNNIAQYLANGKSNPTIAALPETPSQLNVDSFASAPEWVQPQPHSFQRHLPGLPYIGHWGWLGSIQYQRETRDPVTLEYCWRRLIDEPY